MTLFGSRKSWLPLWAALGRSLATSGGRVRNNNLWQSVPNSLGFSTQRPRHSMWPGGGARASPQAAVPAVPAAWRGGRVKLGAACSLCTYMPSYQHCFWNYGLSKYCVLLLSAWQRGIFQKGIMSQLISELLVSQSDFLFGFFAVQGQCWVPGWRGYKSRWRQSKFLPPLL